MADERFQKSKAGGAHHRLASLVGDWEGTTRTWFEPGKLADESPMRGTFRSILDGRFVVHEYEGSLDGEPLHGVALLGYNLDREKFEGAWVDSFHMGSGLMFSEGDGEGPSLSVLGSYGDPTGGAPWGWRTEIEMKDSENIILTAYNISPDGQEAKATETIYSRKT